MVSMHQCVHIVKWAGYHSDPWRSFVKRYAYKGYKDCPEFSALAIIVSLCVAYYLHVCTVCVYVQCFVLFVDAKPVAVQSSVNHNGNHMNGNTSDIILPDPQQLYVAKYDYSTDDSDDLSFNKGDLFYILSNKGDWWLAKEKHSGKEGYIPSNYVAKFQSLEAEE